MNLEKLAVTLTIAGVCWSPVAWSQAAPLEAPKNVKVEPSTAESTQLSTQSDDAEISGDSQAALALAERAIAAYPNDPWGHYDKAAALSRLGRTDEAVKAFGQAEGMYAPSDVWARSVAIYGGAHALAEAGRCDEAKREFLRYAAFVRERDPKSAEMAERYATSCRAPTQPPSRGPSGIPAR